MTQVISQAAVAAGIESGSCQPLCWVAQSSASWFSCAMGTY